MKGSKSKAQSGTISSVPVCEMPVNNQAVDASLLREKAKDKDWLREQYARESLMVREESLKVLHEFEQLDDEATAV